MGNLMFYEAPTGGAFDRKTSNIVGILTKIFLRSQMPWGFPGGGGGGGWAFLDLTDILYKRDQSYGI